MEKQKAGGARGWPEKPLCKDVVLDGLASGGSSSEPPHTHTHSQQAGCRTLSLPTSLQNIFAWCGGKSNILERNKARDLALAIRDSERQGKAQVEIVTDGEEPAEMIQVGGCWGAQLGEAGGMNVVSRGWRVWVSGLGYCLGLWLAHRVPSCDSGESAPLGGWTSGLAGGLGWTQPLLTSAGCPCAGHCLPPPDVVALGVMGWEGLGQVPRNPWKPGLPWSL